jgi:hypothetical protein
MFISTIIAWDRARLTFKSRKGMRLSCVLQIIFCPLISSLIYTTGFGIFADCLKHSEKPRKHSAKSLPSVILDKESSANSTSATTASLPSTFYRALDKDFAECHLVLGKEKSTSRRLVTETASLSSVLGGTRQRVFLFAECPPAQHSATRPPTDPLCQFLC